VNDRLRLSPFGTVLDPVDPRPYEGPLVVRIYPDRVEVRALLDTRITDLGYGLPAPSNNGWYEAEGG
jgi:hypothetical protein